MESNAVKLVGYHGTLKKEVKHILSSGFKARQDDSHWLGQGIYFYDQYEPAYAWANRESAKYLGRHKPSVLEAILETMADKCLDLTNHAHTRQFAQFSQGKKSEMLSCGIDLMLGKSKEQIRCIMLDYYKTEKNLDIIINIFYRRCPQYFSKDVQDIMVALWLDCHEKIICVTEDKCKNVIKRLVEVVKIEVM